MGRSALFSGAKLGKSAMLFHLCGIMYEEKLFAVQFISSEQALSQAAFGSLLIDVRTAEEVTHRAFDVANLTHLPYADLKQHFQDLPTDKPIIFVCKTGKRSQRAAAYLAFKGHPDVSNLVGGIVAWEKAGFPVIKGRGKEGCCTI